MIDKILSCHAPRFWGVGGGGGWKEILNTARRPVSDLERVSGDVVVTERVEGTVGSEVLFHSVLRAEADEPMNGCNAQKHIQQQVGRASSSERNDSLDRSYSLNGRKLLAEKIEIVRWNEISYLLKRKWLSAENQ